MIQFQDEEKAQKKIDDLRNQEEEETVKVLSQKYKLPYLDLSTADIEPQSIRLVQEEKARQSKMAVFWTTGKTAKVGVQNPNKEELKGVLRALELDGYAVELYLVSLRGLEHAWTLYKQTGQEREEAEAGTVLVRPDKLAAVKREIKNLGEVKSRIEKFTAGQTTEVLEIILAGALALEASDVHLEPQPELVRIRYRLDGVLQDVASLIPKTYQLLLSRIKLVSELKLNIHDKPQDGRFTIKSSEAEIEVRVSTMPGPDGENIVMRLLNPEKALGVKFKDLGMQPWVTAVIDKELAKPDGMILTTGPTGSGKTTTLYSFLKKIHSPDIKIITLEDPIEYHLTGVEQTQIDAKKGYDFASGLRAVLRQDPDVILVGEIRDKETAETALQAALTGHLVFSTLHTNNAAGTIPRLLDLGVKATSIAPAVNIAMAQRLIRKLCSSCKVRTELAPEEKKKVADALTKFPTGASLPAPEKWEVYKSSGGGCEKCNFGYKGRTGVYEIILVDDKIETLILKSPSEHELKAASREQGQISLWQDGLLKILAGVTDFAELKRVVGTDEN